MRIKLKDDILTYVNIENEIEEPMSEFQYSFKHTSSISLKFEKLGFRKIVLERQDSTPVEVCELISLLIDKVIDNNKLITVDEFAQLMADRFLTENTEVEVYGR